MKKKLLLVFAILCTLIIATGCEKKEKKEDNKPKETAIAFKKEYEKVNGKTMKDDIKYRTLKIDEKNPYVKISIDEVAKKIKNGESFYLYVGDHLCPWCRSGIEKMIEVANREKIDTIYYVDFWDDDHNEILRELYDVEIKGKKTSFKITQEATEGYKVLYEAVKDMGLKDYTVTKDGKEYTVPNVKKVYGGDHFYFNKGVCKKFVTLRVPSLAKATDELTEEVLKEQDKVYTDLFTFSNACTGEGDC
jgi:hypothetical protein